MFFGPPEFPMTQAWRYVACCVFHAKRIRPPSVHRFCRKLGCLEDISETMNETRHRSYVFIRQPSLRPKLYLTMWKKHRDSESRFV